MRDIDQAKSLLQRLKEAKKELRRFKVDMDCIEIDDEVKYRYSLALNMLSLVISDTFRLLEYRENE